MDVVKVSAKTVEDALTEASIELGTSSDNIEYTVIDEGSKGFFGFGSRKAVIEARRKVSEEDLIKEIFEDKPKKPDKPKKDYKENKKDSKKEYRQEEKQEKKEEKEVKKEQKKDSQTSVDSKKEYKKDSRKDGRKDARSLNSREAVKNDVPAEQSAEDTRKVVESAQSRDLTKKENGARKDSSRKESGREHDREYIRKDSVVAEKTTSAPENVVPKSQEFEQKDSADSEAVVAKDREFTRNDSALSGKEALNSEFLAVDDADSVVPKTPVDPEEAKSRAITFVKDVLSAMDLDDEVTARFEEDTLCVNIEGENMGILIGKRGQTLDSLQYLTSLVVNKGKSSYVRVKVDTEDYRNRRKATLENLAKNIAFKVKKTGKPVFLEPMNPYERRIIHAALQNDPYVTTHSEGEEPYRKVVVTLKKEREKDRDRDRNDRGDRRRSYSRYGNNRRGRGNRQDYERDRRSRRGSSMQDYEEVEGLLNDDAETNVQAGESEE